MTPLFFHTRRRGDWKRRWTLLSLLCLGPLSCTNASSQNVSLAWDPNSEPDLAGYIVYYGNASGQYTNSSRLANTTNTTVSGLQQGGTYYFAVTAYNDQGLESDPSNEVFYQVS